MGFYYLLCLATIYASIAVVQPEFYPVPCFSTHRAAIKAAHTISRFTQVQLTKPIFAADPKGNVVFSPVSIQFALALLEIGAVGKTRDALIDLTKIDSYPPLDSYHNMFVSLHKALKLRSGSNATLRIANGLFFKKGLTFDNMDNTKMDIARLCYEVEPQELPAGDEAITDTINQWVSEKTNKKIPKIFDYGELDPDLALVLANAIYMKASWKAAFNIVENGNFYRFGDQNDAQWVSFARRVGPYITWTTHGFRAVIVPYDGDELEMLLVICETSCNESFANLAQRLGAIFYEDPRLTGKEPLAYLDLSIPKFSIRYKIDLAPVFKEIGEGIIFSPQADFRGFGNDDLKVSKAKHEAFIKVDENGTEAAAVTVIEMRYINSKPEPLRVKFDRPFHFFVRHVKTLAHLFMGRVKHITQDQ